MSRTVAFKATRGDLLRLASIKEAYLADLHSYRQKTPFRRFLLSVFGRSPQDPVEGFTPEQLRKLAYKAENHPAVHIR